MDKVSENNTNTNSQLYNLHTTDCDSTQCTELNCVGNLSYISPGQCCPVCVVELDCSTAICSDHTPCLSGRVQTVKYQCCPICLPLTTPDCATVNCPSLIVCHTNQHISLGTGCCPVCANDTSSECDPNSCPDLSCPESEQILSDDGCCPECPGDYTRM